MNMLPTLIKLWAKLHKIPVTDNYKIRKPFLHFPIGTDRFLIWEWFESKSNEFKILDHLI